MKRYIPLMISGLLMIFVGLYMILRPDGFLTVVISAFGVYLAIDGIRTLIAAYRLKEQLGMRIRGLSMGKALINMLAGLFVIIIALAAPTLIPTVLVYIAAAAFLITGVVDVIDLVVISHAGITAPGLGLETVLSFIFSLILFMFPNFLTGVIMTLFAAVLFASGAMMIYGAISSMVYARKFRNLQ